MQWKHLNYAKQGSLLREECSLGLFFLERSDKKSRGAASRLCTALSATKAQLEEFSPKIGSLQTLISPYNIGCHQTKKSPCKMKAGARVRLAAWHQICFHVCITDEMSENSCFVPCCSFSLWGKGKQSSFLCDSSTSHNTTWKCSTLKETLFCCPFSQCFIYVLWHVRDLES